MDGTGGIFREQACLAIITPGGLHRRNEYYSQLSSHFAHINILLPESIELLHQAVAQSAGEYPLVMVVGGDGTINQVVQKLNLAAQTLIVLPAGRGNDFARALNLPRSFREFTQALPKLSVREMDIWTVNGRRFVNSLGIGLDTEVLKTMAQSKGMLHRNYLAAFLATLPRLKPVNVQANLDGAALASAPLWWVLCMNIPTIGGGMPVTPTADIGDGKLDVLTLENCPKWEMVTKLPKLYAKTHLRDRRIKLHLASEVDLSGWEVPLAIGIDGDLEMTSEARLEIRHAGKLKAAYAAADIS